jgi:hypothetical protein
MAQLVDRVVGTATRPGPRHGGKPRSRTRLGQVASMADQAAPFQQLDFLYTPSRDVATDLAYFTQVLGGRVVFAVQEMGARVAAIRLAEGPPLLLLADHVEGDRPVLVYRVADLGAALGQL